MLEKLILMHENIPYFKIFPFLKPLGGGGRPLPPPPCGAAPAFARSSFITNECSVHPLIPFRKAFWVPESSKLFYNNLLDYTRYLRYFRETHRQSSLSRRLLAFYTWMNRITECLYGVQCRSRGIGRWLKGCPAVIRQGFVPYIGNKVRYMFIYW